MDYLYSLYDALVSINVPSEKARAVVDAMERDMGTTLATKQDLKLLEHQLAGMRTELRQEIGSLRSDLAKDLQALRSDVAKDQQMLRGEVAKDLQIIRSDLGKDMELMRHSMTLRLGSMLAVSLGVVLSVMLTAMRLWL